MKRLKIVLASFILVLMAGMVIFPFGNVFGAWVYFLEAQSSDSKVSIGVAEFYYPPEEIVPGEEATPIGQNHLDLLQFILWEDSKGYGLNINKKPIVHEHLEDPGDVIYCDQRVSGGNLKFMILDNDSVNKLFFCVEKKNDNEYYAYTFAYADLLDVTLYEEKIDVYKTLLRKVDGVWDDIESAHGKAFVIPGSVECGRVIDVSSWSPIVLGQTL